MTVRLDPRGTDKAVILGQPPIHVTSWDYQRLSGVVEAFRSRGCESLVEFLSEELERAELVEPAAVPHDVVTMHSCARFIDHDTDEVRCVTLVYPGEEDSRQGRIAIITPVGSALLGLRPGATMAWRTMDGRIKRLSVLKVRYQPRRAASTVPPFAMAGIPPARKRVSRRNSCTASLRLPATVGTTW